ncbi:hypothetical protein [Metallibacterium scheffleri]|uniref:Uncharacterized protein n=1 Tax=Metallibacterium scheffleri TaxID=993689 RepID=A0A4S3KQF2_9GAMM|nr:hypothetical protein [Metallibacterium scheffleri]THD10688.1 hypothetical protein B1806_07480 [Metallibacterium scheffleri]
MSDTNSSINVTIVAPRKSPFAAALLALFFGPLGMFYSTLAGALIMLAVYVVLIPLIGVMTLGLGFWLYLLAWPVCVVWAGLAAVQCNQTAVRYSQGGG